MKERRTVHAGGCKGRIGIRTHEEREMWRAA